MVGVNRIKKRGQWTGAVFCMIAAILALPMAASGEKPGGEPEAGNNLSFPVIWAEGGYSGPTPPGTAGMEPVTEGEWWYWWGTNEDGTPKSCQPLSYIETDESACKNGNNPGEGWIRAYVQKEPDNTWQADSMSMDGTYNAITVDWIDWGDNLESVDWYTRSQVRAEVVLYEDLNDGDLEDSVLSMTEYEMRHVYGWGIDEVHGLAKHRYNGVTLGSGTQATVYSDCARLTIQKLFKDRDDSVLANLIWNNDDPVYPMWSEPYGWPGDDLVNDPIFNLPVYEGGDGPGYYSAEINVKGKVIYGYTWNVRNLNDYEVNGGDADGDYRITFSFDDASCSEELNTFFRGSIPQDLDGTQIMLPDEDEESGDETNNETGGGTAVIDFDNNLTYIDVRILERSGGGGGGKKR